MELFWREVKPQKEPVQLRWFLPAVVVLVVASVPWYLPTGFVGRIYAGLPIWIWMTLGCSLLIAVVTSFVALRSWHDDEPSPLTEDEIATPPRPQLDGVTSDESPSP